MEGGVAGALRKAFWGPNGIRAGWRLILFFGIGTAIVYAVEAGLEYFPPTARILSAHVRGVLTLAFGAVVEIPQFLAVFLSALIMTKIERRSFGAYGLPLKGVFGKLFWIGVLWGLATMSAEMATMAALGGFSFETFALSGVAAIQYGLGWAFGFLLVGLAEEFQYRGYAQYTLSTAIGFWPSAVVWSAVFAWGHRGNLGENWMGLVEVIVFSFFCCFTLWRTGTLWFAVGFHAAGDFAEQFLFSVPNSGLRATGVLLNSSVHGPNWLTGGTVGPEGSVLSLILLAISFVVFARLYPRRSASAVSSPADLADASPPEAT